MFNLEACRRIWPPSYTATMEVSCYDEFHYLALWGQLYDKDWRIKEVLARQLFDSLDSLVDIQRLAECFPYRVLRPRCAIEEHYRFYGVE